MSYSQASQSHYSFCADSDLGLNTDLLYSDDISELISSQTPLTSTSQISSPIAPLSLTRVGLPLQQYWVLYSSEPSSEMEESHNTVLQDTTREAPDDEYGDLDAACASQNQPQDELSKPEDDEIARYLARGIEIQKPRAFWKDHELEFPILARIARDILSIPASGAGVERLFNCARDICHYRRGQLKPSTIRGLMLHQFATNFDVEQKEIEVIKEYLSIGEAALLDQARKPMLHLETLEPISDNEEEDQEPSIQDTQQKRSCNDDSDDERNNDQSKQVQRKRSKKRLSESLDEDDDDLPEMPIDESMLGRSGRIRKQPRLPDGFQIDLR
ncbi:uncharacterized protein N7529_005454 [Penicillium soppii]|uniref:uncharacterized protein n=1 Tax=Penicillium soppii TaxID=69789 RepID=UPI0025470D4E|nr:uncharacterized protein N7529_005454 [Penicillium soppii]KAJ5863538.1 hypothetical protein N7529_005454 [Penicillium soppii]